MIDGLDVSYKRLLYEGGARLDLRPAYGGRQEPNEAEKTDMGGMDNKTSVGFAKDKRLGAHRARSFYKGCYDEPMTRQRSI